MCGGKGEREGAFPDRPTPLHPPRTAIGHVDNGVLDWAVKVLGIHTFGGAKGQSTVEFLRVGVDGDDPVGTSALACLNNCEPHCPNPEHSNTGPGFHFCCVEDGTISCR